MPVAIFYVSGIFISFSQEKNNDKGENKIQSAHGKLYRGVMRDSSTNQSFSLIRIYNAHAILTVLHFKINTENCFLKLSDLVSPTFHFLLLMKLLTIQRGKSKDFVPC